MENDSPIQHNWNVTPAQAKEIQNDLRSKVQLTPFEGNIEYIAGADISFNRFEDTVYAGIVVMRLDTLEVVEEALIVSEAKFPYIPGLLSFRETPVLLETWEKLKIKPDILVADGQGIAHPRRFGIACHIGILLDLPTFGCAKNILVGKYEEPDQVVGSTKPMTHEQEKVGVILRTKTKVKPVYISAGHRITLQQSIDLALKCTTKYRIPEPTRQAHLAVNRLRKGAIR